jgi:hypothetical protein
MYAPMANGVAVGFDREQPQMTVSRPKVAMNSPSHCAAPVRT